MSNLTEKVTDKVSEYTVYLFAYLIVIPIAIWIFRVLFGSLWWLGKGTFGSFGICNLIESPSTSSCQITTGLIGVDRIFNWFFNSDLLLTMPVFSLIALIVGLLLWFTLTSQAKK
jgi:hypothetical protein